MKRETGYFLTRSNGQTLVLAHAGGMFVTLGALLVALPFWYALANRNKS
jgi:hypothetical protein